MSDCSVCLVAAAEANTPVDKAIVAGIALAIDAFASLKQIKEAGGNADEFWESILCGKHRLVLAVILDTAHDTHDPMDDIQ